MGITTDCAHSANRGEPIGAGTACGCNVPAEASGSDAGGSLRDDGPAEAEEAARRGTASGVLELAGEIGEGVAGVSSGGDGERWASSDERAMLRRAADAARLLEGVVGDRAGTAGVPAGAAGARRASAARGGLIAPGRCCCIGVPPLRCPDAEPKLQLRMDSPRRDDCRTRRGP